MTAPLLKIEGLTAGYGDVQVLWGIDLEVRPGEITCIVGSNGAGKSTLLRTISGLVRATGGLISFGGKTVTGADPDAAPAASSALAAKQSPVPILTRYSPPASPTCLRVAGCSAACRCATTC